MEEKITNQLINLLCKMPVLQDTKSRDSLLKGLPVSLQNNIPRSNITRTDIMNIVDNVINGRVLLNSNKYVWEIVIDNARQFVEGTTIEVELQHIKNYLNQAINDNTFLDPSNQELNKIIFADDNLTTLPSEIGRPINDNTFLDLSNQELNEFPLKVTQQVNLQILLLADNNLTTLPPEIGNLVNLKILDLNNNQLTNLPPEIKRLSKLQYIGLYNNKLPIPAEILEFAQPVTRYITDISPVLTRKLQDVLLRSNFFNSDNSLKALFVDSRIALWQALLPQTTNITARVTQMISLLMIRSNTEGENALVLFLQVLSDRIHPDDKLHHDLVDLANKLNFPTKQINISPQPPRQTTILPTSLINYCLQNQQDKRPLNEAKVLLVGQGGVGKTSLVQRLVNDDFDPHEAKTEGIAVKHWLREVRGEHIHLRLWDFGGQEIMHATHQFFLTRRSLYLLVIDARKGEQESNLEYWLKIIQSFGDDAPIIIVLNKIDEHRLELDRKTLQAKYPTIRAFVETSCQTGHGIKELKVHLDHEVTIMEHLRTVWLKSWFQVKTILEQLAREFISYEDYIEICETAAVTDEPNQHILLGFLHDLGVVLNYRDDPRLEETNVLKPAWVTDAVYKILNSQEMFESKGVLKRSHLQQILDKKRYPRLSTRHDNLA